MVNADGKDEVEDVVTPPTQPEGETEETTENATDDSTTTTTAVADGDDTDAPSTGDHTPIALIVTIMIVASLSATMMITLRKKKNEI